MLTPKQERFVDEYMLDHSGAAAAVRAGYAPGSAKVTACRLLTRANVKEALRARRARAQAEFKVSREHVMQGFLEAVAEARAASNPMAQIRGWSEIAKMLGFYAPEQREVKLSTKSAARRAEYEAMSDEELVEIIRAAGGKITREPGPVKGGKTIIAFVEDPTRYMSMLIPYLAIIVKVESGCLGGYVQHLQRYVESQGGKAAMLHAWQAFHQFGKGNAVSPVDALREVLAM